MATAAPPHSSAASQDSSETITAKAKSNLAFALATLPKARRKDMTTFYAFCRVVDDIADDPAVSLDQKKATLERWKRCIESNIADVERYSTLLAETLALAPKHTFDRNLLVEIIDGVLSDQVKNRYANFEELREYCYKVASVVGLVSAHIFGATHPQSRDYAIQLGYALQLTNIIRDVGEDARETGRIYLPQDELVEFGVAEADIMNERYSREFTRLMEFQYRRAYRYYQAAAGLLPESDRNALIAARMMAQVYNELLEKLRVNGYRVFHVRERLSTARLCFILASYWLRGCFARI